MNTDWNSKVSSDSGQTAYTPGCLMIFLWLLIGASMGALLYSLADQWLEGDHMKQAKVELTKLYAQILPTADQQLAGINQMQDQLTTELMLARMAAETKDIKLTVYRAMTKQIKARIERADQTLRRLNEENIKTSAILKLPSDAKVVPTEQQQRLVALEQLLGESRQDLTVIENRIDDLAERWSQLVLKEADAEKKVLEQKVQFAVTEARAQSEPKLLNNLEMGNLVLTEARLRSQTETERARVETLHQVTLDTLLRLQPATPAAAVPIYQPIVRCYREPIVCGSTRNHRWSGAYYCRPNVYRFGPYLVVNN